MGQRLKKPPTKKEYEYVHWLDTFYWENDGRFPAPELAAQVLNWPIETINELNNSKTVKLMCKNRGIEVKVIDTSRLLPEQITAANVYLNLADDRPIKQKLDDLGINPQRFWGWMQGTAFKTYLQSRAEELFQLGMPIAHRELMAKIMKGDIRAIRLFYEISGRHTGVNSLEGQNFQVMTQRLIEAIQIEVQDQEVIQRIAERFKAIMAGEMPTSQQALPVKVPSHFNEPEEVKITNITHPVGGRRPESKNSDIGN